MFQESSTKSDETVPGSSSVTSVQARLLVSTTIMSTPVSSNLNPRTLNLALHTPGPCIRNPPQKKSRITPHAPGLELETNKKLCQKDSPAGKGPLNRARRGPSQTMLEAHQKKDRSYRKSQKKTSEKLSNMPLKRQKTIRTLSAQDAV